MSASQPVKGRLMDCATLQRELGVSRAAAEKIMRQLPKVRFDGLQKTYVYRDDVEQLLEASTIDSTTTRPRVAVLRGGRSAA